MGRGWELRRMILRRMILRRMILQGTILRGTVLQRIKLQGAMKVLGMYLFTFLTLCSLCACGRENGGTGGVSSGVSADIMGVESQAGDIVGAGATAAAADNTAGGVPAEVGELLRVRGQLYRNTGDTHNVLRCGMLDGRIASQVTAEEIPAEDDQSNFGVGFGYQYGGKNTIEVNMNDNWYVFRKVFVDSEGIIVPVLTDVYSMQIVNASTGEEMEISRENRAEDFWEVVEKYEALDINKSENQVSATDYLYRMQLCDEAGKPLHTVTPKGRYVEQDGVRYEALNNTTAVDLFMAVDALWEEHVAMGELLPTERQELDVVDGLYMEVTYATPRGISLLFTNDSELNITYGDSYSLQTYRDGCWYEVGYIIENWAFTCIGYELPPGSSGGWGTRYAHFHGELTPGTYRIVKDVLDFRGTGDYTEYYIGAIFEIK